jgi:tetratricopeptide (TPR) repeat protein
MGIRLKQAAWAALTLVLMLCPVAARADDAQTCTNATSDPDVAIAACTALINAGNKPAIETAFLARGNAWFRKGDYDRAIPDFEAAIQHNARFVEAFRALGQTLVVTRDYPKAIKDLTEAIAIDPTSYRAYYLRGFAFYSTGSFEQAIKDFDKSLALKNDYIPAYLHRGDTYYAKRDYDRAIKDFNDIVRLAPRNPLGYIERAAVWIDRNELDHAIQDYDTAIGLDATNWRAFSGRGEARRRKGIIDQALADHNEAIRLNPKSANALINRALSWKDKGDLDKAISDLDDALLIDPNNDRIFSIRGDFFRVRGELVRSLADLDKAVTILPQSAMNHCRRGETLRASGELDRALQDFSAAIQISANAICGYAGRGQVREAKGDLTAAKADYDKALSLPPEKDPDPFGGKEAQVIAQERSAVVVAALVPTGNKPPPEPRKQVDLGVRVALVVGNSGYVNFPQIPNPRNDATDLAKALQGVGFKVLLGTDLKRSEMEDIFIKFARESRSADTALVYYAGHGIQYNGINYLAPIDAQLQDETDLRRFVNLQDVIGDLQTVGKVRILIVDACRDNKAMQQLASRLPASRSLAFGQHGLAPTEADGTLIAFATQANQVAADGQGRNSPFAQALLKNIGAPGVELRTMLTRVRADVVAATGGTQRPEVWDSMIGEFEFKP